MSLQPGDLLQDRYQIQEIIAQGGMGAVYRAFDQALNIQVAVKENYRESEQFARQFRREAALLAALHHPNLPRVTDHFTTPTGGQYLVMDFVEGNDLRELLASQSSLPEAEVVRIGAEVCAALNYLHTRIPPVIHRDVKPGNVKITPAGQVFLVDFGLAKELAGEATTTGAQALTPGYAPPEQYGQGTEPRSDVYALGATLYAALTGSIPQDGLSRAMGTVELTPIRSHNSAISSQTVQAVEKAMAVRPSERHSSAAEFRTALLHPDQIGHTGVQSSPLLPTPAVASSTASDAVPTVARPPAAARIASSSGSIPTAQPSIRWLSLLGLGGMLLVALAFIITLPGWLQRPAALPAEIPPSPSSPANTSTLAPTDSPSATVTPAPSSTAVNQIVVDQPILTSSPPSSPTPQPPTPTPRGGARWLAISSDRSGSQQIWLTDADGAQTVQITNLPDGACQADWSPDGQQLVFISPCAGRKESYPGASLYIIRSDGTGLIPLASIPGGDFDPAWSPDGSKIAFTSLRSGKPNIYLYDLSTNQTVLISNPVNYERRPAWSPDGQWIAFETTLTGQSQIWIMNSAGKDRTEFSPSASGVSRMPAWASDGTFILYSRGGDLPVLMSRAFPAKGNPEIHLAELFTGVEDNRVSPDGWQLAFTLFDYSGSCDIYIISRSGTGVTRLTDSPGIDFHPAWQP